jgi:sugar (pentulose or hexulose) kinase
VDTITNCAFGGPEMKTLSVTAGKTLFWVRTKIAGTRSRASKSRMNTDKDLVIGIDSSTTATKAVAWKRDGALAGLGRSSIPLASPANDRYEQDPEDWWRSACEALRGLFQEVAPERIAGVAISNQRETFVPLGPQGVPVRPAIVWLDQRCDQEVPWLTGKVGADKIHRISGKPPDMAPVAYRIAWMLRRETDLFRATRMFTDVHGYLVWRLTGAFRTSWASADPLGLFDMQNKTWSEEVMDALELRPDQLPEPVAPASAVGRVSEAAAAATGLAPGTLVVAGGGDGQAAGLGVNALTPWRAYLNLGTAVVSGTYSREYRTDTAWRTMGSCSGEGYIYETSLRAGTFLVDWLARQVCQAPAEDKGIYQRLEAEAAGVPAGSHGLLTLPYWGAVMTPYWDPKARGCFVGLTGSHRLGHLYRSVLEGIALEQALVTGMIEERTGVQVREFIAIGGGASSDLWCQIVADASGKTVRRSTTVEASSLGAAMCAAVGAGWFPDAAAAAEAMSGEIIRETEPSPDRSARYSELLGIYREIYPRLRETFSRLTRFAAAS